MSAPRDASSSQDDGSSWHGFSPTPPLHDIVFYRSTFECGNSNARQMRSRCQLMDESPAILGEIGYRSWESI